jgi:glucokinase
MILAGDIGGTKTRLALFDLLGDRLHCLAEEKYASRSCASLLEVVSAFVGKHRLRVKAACFGVAGPVRHGRAQATNLPWVVDAVELGQELGLARAGLINDLEANAHGLAALPPEDLLVLNPGEGEAVGNAAIISAGTGLGEAGLFWDGTRHLPFASEGGHTDFAPSNDLQSELLGYLRVRFGHASWERVLSGPGLVNIYEFLRDSARGEEPIWLKESLHGPDPAAAITKAALNQTSDLCEQALNLFVALYGAEAGNLALKLMATGGVFIGGGIAPKILPRLKDGTFMQTFVSKGRLQPFLEAICVRVVLNDRTALLGAACYARHCLSEPSQQTDASNLIPRRDMP